MPCRRWPSCSPTRPGFGDLAGGRGPRRRRLGEARRRPRRRRRDRARAASLGRRRRGPRAGEGHRPRRRRVRRRRAGAHRPARGRVGALRPDVERRRRHRARASQLDARRPTSCWRRSTPLEAVDRHPRSRVPRHADGRPHARHPRRAHDVRGQARALGAAGAARSRAPGAGPRRRSRSASCRARSARTRTSIPRSRRTCASSSGLAPVPATQVLARDRHAEFLYACASVGAIDRGVRARDPPPAAHRGRRGRGAVPRRRAEGLERDAPQAQPGEVRAAVRARACAAGEPAGRARGCRALARARHLALVGRAHHPPRLAAARVLRAGAVPDDRRRARRLPRAHAARTSTRRTGSCSASRCCSRSSRAGSRRDDAYRLVQRNAIRSLGGAATVP